MARSFLDRVLGHSAESYAALTPEARAAVTRGAIPDLHFFFDEGRAFADRDAPPRTRALAQSLFDALVAGEEPEAVRRTLRERIVTDRFLREEADRDQNVYLGRLFTRVLTRAVPDLVFQPATAGEAERALAWARHGRVPVTLRGAASTAMGGSVPNDGGLTLDVSRLDEIRLDASEGVCVIGAGARLREVHARLAERGFALPVYPSNLGGTLAGWFLTGGVGLNAFGRGVAADHVKAADVVLPGGQHVRFHDDGRLDVSDAQHRRATLAPAEAAAWFRSLGCRPLALDDLAGSEGVFGLVLQLTVRVEPRPEIGAFLLSFTARERALEAAAWIADRAGETIPAPANLKLLSRSHLHHVRRARADEEARDWRRRPGALSGGAGMPWTRIEGPRALGAAAALDPGHATAFLYVDFLALDEARAFATVVPGLPGAPVVLEEESVRFAAERFRPQMTKRLGPGLVAAEVVMPARELGGFLPRADRIAHGVGAELDAEVYFIAGGPALVIAATLTDHRSAGFLVDLALAPVLTDLAMARHHGRPYVLGRWQSPWLARKFGPEVARRRVAVRRALDPAAIVNRGVLTGLRLRGPLGRLFAAGFRPGVSLARLIFGAAPLASGVRLARRWLGGLPGPAWARGEPARIGARFAVPPADPDRAAPGAAPGAAAPVPDRDAGGPPPQRAAARALHCVNCGECNSVCPIFHESAIRLPQMLTHLGESAHAGAPLPGAAAALLDLCMRCGNCEEVCQAGIPHLPLYEDLQAASNAARDYDRERHAVILGAVRGSEGYQREFLGVRKGGYQKRTPASLAGTVRYLVLRAEGDAGPAATCIHCGACVPVCPTHANRELEGGDPRWITTVQERCIGCGTCVEVCPANERNGGQTLRVMEAPTADWFGALDEYERITGTPVPKT